VYAHIAPLTATAWCRSLHWCWVAAHQGGHLHTDLRGAAGEV